jgi:hypothetical protein
VNSSLGGNTVAKGKDRGKDQKGGKKKKRKQKKTKTEKRERRAWPK